MPDPQYMTHINYAFGHVNESFNGVKIDNEERLRQIVDLRKQKPELKVLLSIGGWGSGRFSEMAANDEYRRAFAADCDRVVKEFALDGIDIDWGISHQLYGKYILVTGRYGEFYTSDAGYQSCHRQ